MIKIIRIEKSNEMFNDAVNFFWKQWGNNENRHFYEDCMKHADSKDVPLFYIAIHNEDIVGSYAILRTDLVSRQDLIPWFACLYVSPTYRGKNIGQKLLEHGKLQAKKIGYQKLYLSTNLEHYYERYGWRHTNNTCSIDGTMLKVYEHEIK